jgi:hypothetical protein
MGSKFNFPRTLPVLSTFQNIGWLQPVILLRALPPLKLNNIETKDSIRRILHRQAKPSFQKPPLKEKSAKTDSARATTKNGNERSRSHPKDFDAPQPADCRYCEKRFSCAEFAEVTACPKGKLKRWQIAYF